MEYFASTFQRFSHAGSCDRRFDVGAAAADGCFFSVPVHMAGLRPFKNGNRAPPPRGKGKNIMKDYSFYINVAYGFAAVILAAVVYLTWRDWKNAEKDAG